MRDLRRPDHLPNHMTGGEPSRPDWLPRQRAGTTPQMIGRFPDYDVLRSAAEWDEATRAVVLARLEPSEAPCFFEPEQYPTLHAFCDVVLAQDEEPRVPVAALVDEKLAAGRLDGYQYADMPDDRETWRLTLAGLDHTAAELAWPAGLRRMRARGPQRDRRWSRRGPALRRPLGSSERRARVVGLHAHDARGLLLPPLGVERDRLRRTGIPAGLHAARSD